MNLATASLTRALVLPHLKRLSRLLGFNTTGTKSALVTQILSLTESSIPSLQPSPPQICGVSGVANAAALEGTCRILSIDMGIRNLAYCVLTASQLSSSPPVITAWTRTSLSLFPVVKGDAFSLPVFAAFAYQLASDLNTAHGPLSHVLIERQRWRSGGGSNVYEWTIRVNTLEAMLHSSFHSIRGRGSGCLDSAINTGVESISPARVADMWLPESVTTTGERVKKAKTEVVKDWLRGGKVLELENDAVRRTAELVLVAGERARAMANGTKIEKEDRKVDDVVDCVLQAMAWLRWMRNRQEFQAGRLPKGMDGVPWPTEPKASTPPKIRRKTKAPPVEPTAPISTTITTKTKSVISPKCAFFKQPLAKQESEPVPVPAPAMVSEAKKRRARNKGLNVGPDSPVTGQTEKKQAGRRKTKSNDTEAVLDIPVPETNTTSKLPIKPVRKPRVKKEATKIDIDAMAGDSEKKKSPKKRMIGTKEYLLGEISRRKGIPIV